MNRKPLIMILVAFLAITFGGVPTVNANPLLIAAIPVVALLSASGILATKAHNENQVAKENKMAANKDINNSGEETLMVQKEGEMAK